MAGKWTVVAQRQYEELTPQGTFSSVTEVTFQLTSGTTGSVKIPTRLYNAQSAFDAVDARATEMTKVENLAG